MEVCGQCHGTGGGATQVSVVVIHRTSQVSVRGSYTVKYRIKVGAYILRVGGVFF